MPHDAHDTVIDFPARRASRRPLEEENAMLRQRIRQQDLTLGLMSDALVGLRRGSAALRDENRDLRAQLEAVRLVRHETGR